MPETTAALFEEVRVAFRGLVDRFPDNPDAWEMLARAHFWLGDSAEATVAWKRCLELNPQYVYAYHGMARVAVKKGDYDEAIALLRKALAASPEVSQTEMELATALVDAGQPEEAIALVDAYVKKAPGNAAAFVLLGMACLETNDLEKARASYEAAIQLEPKHANAHHGLAAAYTRLGLMDKARECTDAFNRLRAEERQVRQDERAAYDDIQEMRALTAELYTDAARLYHAHRETADAERLLRRATRLDPDAVECRQALAWICRGSGRAAEAIEILGRLSADDPRNPGYPLEIGRLQASLGNQEAAAAAFRQALALDPENAECREALNSLNEEQ